MCCLCAKGRLMLLSAENISLQKQGQILLEEIDFTIEQSEIVTLIGPNGGGKTTLVRALLGIQPIDKGRIIRKTGLTIGYVPQKLHRDRSLPMTVHRFMRLLKSYSEQDIITALAEVDATHLLSSQLAYLSGGELQRVLLARALLSKPDLLVLDEPAQGVDFAGEAELYKLIVAVKQRHQCAVLLISHDLHLVFGASDRVICINRHICCEGVPEQVTGHPEYARLFGPETAKAYGIYAHSHDHAHDLSGAVCHQGHNHTERKTVANQAIAKEVGKGAV